ncbi:alpha/beta fold hydrolase [Paenibacillus sp. IB182496]|uniref:Alpha/beta fold hydrolase n=1 Tax=Paenibacillus sabuli TaxID=2772509 RepID=A0A927BNP9_9BACL|nr:dienelactone hydrolase family protein [Paenibacillus sabuli]MBD2843896.1 alpha/beta fold hydrolase [Paenibacillus sabuli]
MHEVDTTPFRLPLTNDGAELTLRGDIRAPRDGGPWPTVVLVHGFKGFKDWSFFPYAAERLARAGMMTVTFNFSCNGVGEGTDFDELDKYGANTYAREQADLAALLGALRAEELPGAARCDTRRLALLGHSRGGGNSLIRAAEDAGIGAVVTWNGIGDVDLFSRDFRQTVLQDGIGYVENARTKQQMPITAAFFEDLDANAERYDLPTVLAGLRTPVLLLQGDADSARLLDGFRRLREAAPAQTYAGIEGAGHTFGAVHPFAGTTAALEEALERTLAFLGTQRIRP